MTSISLLRAVRMINTVSGRPVRMARARSDSVAVGQPQIQEDDPGSGLLDLDETRAGGAAPGGGIAVDLLARAAGAGR